MELRTAERKKTKIKIAISSPSGGGKTYSSLLLAKGLVGNWEKIAVIDTENDSASLYDHLGPYKTLSLTPPYTPERYVEAINKCVAAGMEAVIIDSMSHEWEAEGGALDLQAQLGGKYQDWSKVSPRHGKFIQAILHSPVHIIGTMRRKTDYEMTKEGNKTIVQKVGLKAVQREGTEYEFTIHLALSQNHLALAEKDRTGLFMDKPEFIITEETGVKLKNWVSSGKNTLPLEEQEFKGTHEQIEFLKLACLPHNFSGVEKKEILKSISDRPMSSLSKIIAAQLEKKQIVSTAENHEHIAAVGEESYA